jgi:alpha-glucosidase
MKDPRLRNNPPAKPREVLGKKIAHEYQEHRYDREHPDLHQVFREFRRLLDSYSREQPRAAFAEIHVSGGWEAWSKYYGVAQDEFHFPFNSGFIGIEWKLDQVRKLVDEFYAGLPEDAWPNAHTGNFDEWRAASRFGPAGARQAAMLLLTLRGTPLLYYGEEIGMSNTVIPPEYERDPMGKRIGLNRDPQRTPMQWDPGPYAGFSAHNTPRLWLPVNSNYRQVNVETELQDPASFLNLYRELIALRKSSPALQLGSFQTLESAPEGCYAYLRLYGDEIILVALNFSSEPLKLPLSERMRGEIAVSTLMDRSGPFDPLDLELRGQEGVVIKML